jgi:kumamolisin
MTSHVPLSGSYREHPANSAPAGKPAGDEIIQLTLLLRRRNQAPDPQSLRRHFTHAELAEIHGADPADIEAVEAFASQHHFSVVRIHAAARSVTIAGPLARLANVFGADLELRLLGPKTVRTRQGSLRVPQSLHGRVLAIFGFDQRPAAASARRFRPRTSETLSYTPLEIAKLYNFPLNTAKGQTIALIELGGGFNNSDLRQYWRQLGLSDVAVTAISVSGAHNSPDGNPAGADGEVALDIEVAGAVAPGARIAVYFATNTDQGFFDAINGAIHDTVRKPSVISISWGMAESEWTPQAMDAFNAAFHDAALLGISVCAASGDNGSPDGEQDGKNHVDFPASSPWVLGCGGTRLVASSGIIASETVWNDGTTGGASGGGVSSHFSQPAYQAGLKIPKPTATANATGRGVPDVAADADPQTGYAVIVDGQEGVVGGTSAVAPLWAALIALFNQQLGRNIGWFHPVLYSTLSQHKALHDIVSGTNGAFNAAPGWDPCTGLGSPNGQTMLALLEPSPEA